MVTQLILKYEDLDAFCGQGKYPYFISDGVVLLYIYIRRRHRCYCHVADTAGIYFPHVRDGQTSHAVTGACAIKEIMLKNRTSVDLYSEVAFASTKLLLMICRYCRRIF
jgi:hypothetical protein